MSNRKWSKRWLYDSTVEVPKATKWRRRIEVNNPHNDEEIVDVRGHFVTEVIDLGSNTSPFKKQKTLGDCLPSTRNETHPSERCNLGEKFNSSNDALKTGIQTEHGVMSSFVSRQENAYSESTCLQDELADCGDTNQIERDGSAGEIDTTANDCEDESLMPDLWQKMSCGDGLHEDSNCFDAVDCNDGLELADCYRESLLGELNFDEEIPDMECFKNTPAAQSEDQEPLRDEQALYQDSPLTVAESSLLLMAFSVRHKLSGVALEDLLELIQLHCPKPNKCITELKEFQLFFQALKHPIVKHYYCPNLICKLYVGTSKPENTSKCAVCGTPLCSSAYFIEIPIVEQLRTILSGPGMIKKLQYRFSRTKIDPGAIEDVYDGELYKKHFCPGGFLSNQHNISFPGNTGGVALIQSNGYGVWPVYLVVNEIPSSESFTKLVHLPVVL